MVEEINTALGRQLRELECVDQVTSRKYDSTGNIEVEFHISEGLIPPEVSRVLAVNNSTLFDGCLSNSHHEFRAWANR